MRKINEISNGNCRSFIVCTGYNDYLWLGNDKTEKWVAGLFSKGESKVKKYLKNHDYITIKDVEKLSENLEAKQVFSPNKIVVKDKKDYARQLMNYMVKTGQVEIEENRYKKAGKH